MEDDKISYEVWQFGECILKHSGDTAMEKTVKLARILAESGPVRVFKVKTHREVQEMTIDLTPPAPKELT